MMWERSIPKIKPQTESRRESTGTGRYGHVRNISRSMIDGDFSNANSQPESTDARKDQLQITNKKSHDHGLTRSSSTKHEATRNGDLSIIKKPVEHHYMKTTKCFNAKSQRPVDLEIPKVKKKPDPDPYGIRRKSENIRGVQHHKLAEPNNPYLKARSRPSSVDSQLTPMLKRSPSLNSSRVPRQNRQQGTAKPTGKTKSGTRGETEVGSFTSDHFGYVENGESVVKEIVEDKCSYLHSDKQESMLEIDETEIKADMISQTSNKDEIELLEETGDSDLSFKPEIPSGHESSEKLEVVSENLPEMETKETIMEGSPKHPDSNLEVITENKTLEKYEVTQENISEIEKDVTESFPPEKITREEDEKYEEKDAKYEEIDDLCVLSGLNDETDDLCKISIEDELSKIISTENAHCTEQEHKALSIDIMSIIEEIANELEAMEKDPAGEYCNDMHPKWMLKKWKVDYVVQRLVQKLEYTDKNQVSKLIQAYESIIPLMMRRVAVPVPHQTSSQ